MDYDSDCDPDNIAPCKQSPETRIKSGSYLHRIHFQSNDILHVMKSQNIIDAQINPDTH